MATNSAPVCNQGQDQEEPLFMKDLLTMQKKLKSGDLQLVDKANAKSKVWEHMGVVWLETKQLSFVACIGGHGTLQKYRGTGTRYFAKISTAVPVLSN